jgi:hypothetical protein
MNAEDINDQFAICAKHKNHPKMDLALCRECKTNRRCQAYQEYLQPSLPWIKAGDNNVGSSQMKKIVPGHTSATCRKCSHYQGNSKCEAFPEKIPTEILLGYVSHLRPHKDDQGIQFESADKAEKQRSNG